MLYTALTLFSLTFAAYIFLNSKSHSTVPELRERTGVLANDPEWPATKANIEKLLADLNARPGDVKTMLRLAAAFMQEGRVTGDYSYYNKTALDLVNQALAKLKMPSPRKNGPRAVWQALSTVKSAERESKDISETYITCASALSGLLENARKENSGN